MNYLSFCLVVISCYENSHHFLNIVKLLQKLSFACQIRSIISSDQSNLLFFAFYVSSLSLFNTKLNSQNRLSLNKSQHYKMYWSESQGQDEKIVIKFSNYDQITQEQLQASKINNILRNYVVKPVQTLPDKRQEPQIQLNTNIEDMSSTSEKTQKQDAQQDDMEEFDSVDDQSDREILEQLKEEIEKDKLYNKTNKMVIKEFAFHRHFSVKSLKELGIKSIEDLQSTFKKLETFIGQKYSISLYEIRYVIYKTDPNKWSKEEVRRAEKNYFRRVEQSINLIMELYQNKSTQRELISLDKLFSTGKTENQYTMLNYGKSKPNMKKDYKECVERNWREFKENTYVYFKLLVYNYNQFFLNNIQLLQNGVNKKVKVCLPKKGQVIDYIDDQRQLIKINNVGLGTFYQDQYYSYFDANSVYYHARARNSQISTEMSVYFQEYKGKIKALVIICRFFNQFSLKLKFSWQKINRVQIYEATAENKFKVSYFLHLSDCPQYYIITYKNNQYTSPKFQQLGERVQNFPLLSNQVISQNEVLRMYLYNNTVIKIDILEDSEAHSFTRFNQYMRRVYKSYEKYLKQQILINLPYKGKRQTQLSNILSMQKLNNILDEFQIPDKPTLSHHIRWKSKYHILLLVRFNLIHTSYCGLLEFLHRNLKDLEIVSQILLNKTIRINDRSFKEDKLLLEEIQKDLINVRQKYKILQGKSTTEKIDIMQVRDSQFGKIYKILLTPSGVIYKSPTPERRCRLLKKCQKETQFFCKITLKDDSRQPLKNKRYLILYFMRNQLDVIDIAGKIYKPLASSNSQLRSSSLWVVNPILKAQGQLKSMDRDSLLKFLGNFDKIEIPAKKYARIGQSFSSCWSMNGENIISNQEEDVYGGGYMFTDGIGKISETLLKNLLKGLKLSQSQKKQICSIQIRYEGSKGVLTKFHNLKQNQIILRPSMIKYQCQDSQIKKYFDILEWNKYRSGFLNRQIIILLKSLGIKDQVFEQLQQEYIYFLQNLNYSQVLTYRLLHTDLDDVAGNYQPSFQIIDGLNKTGFKLDTEPFFQGVLKYIKLQKFQDLNAYCHILNKKSARLMGIIDDYKLLKEGQLFCCIYNQHDLQNQLYNVRGDVIVTKNPALDPADVRKMKCIQLQEMGKRCQERGYQKNYFQEFSNCVVFPCVGNSPVTAQISGSDLDGDLFLICWDQNLRIKKHRPETYIDSPKKPDEKKEQSLKKVVAFEQMIDFFVEYINSEKLGTIDNSHLVHADKNPIKCANSKICKKLAYYHGKAVDYGKTGDMPVVPKMLLAEWLPSYMRKHGKVYTSTSILGMLYNSSSNFVDYLDAKEQQATIGELDTDILRRCRLEVDDQECRQMIHLLYEFESSLQEIIRLLKVDKQHQIYLGMFDTKEARKNNLGVNRVYMFILHFRRTFFDKFFEGFNKSEKQHYHTIGDSQKSKKYQFEEQLIQKTIRFYLASYCLKYKTLKGEITEQFKKFIQKMQHFSKQYNYKGKFAGFVWFIVPKLMVYIKMTCQIKLNVAIALNDS